MFRSAPAGPHRPTSRSHGGALLAAALAGTGATTALASPGPGNGCPPSAIAVPANQSIQPVVERAGPGASLCLKAGIHRLQSVMPLGAQRFFGEPGTVLNGSRLLTAFEPQGSHWVAPHQRVTGVKRGSCKDDRKTCTFAVGFFMDDRPLEQVGSAAELGPGRFLYDQDGGRVVFADDPTGKVVELTAARFAFRSAAQNVLISGMTIEKYFSPPQEGAIQGWYGKGWRIEDSDIRLNSGAGVTVGSGGTVLNSRIHRNGQLGIGGAGEGILIEGNEIFGNNIYGFDNEWESGGVKVAVSKGVTFRRNHVHGNAGPGLWCDIDCRDVLYEHNRIEDNDDAGIYHEISFNAVIRHNVVGRNGRARPWLWGADIQISASQDVEVHGNIVTVRPEGNGIVMVDQSRKRERGGRYMTVNNHIHDNTIIIEGVGRTGGASDAPPGDPNFTVIQDGGNRFERNRYRLRPGATPTFVWGQKVVDFAAFQALGQERGGVFAIETK